MNEKAQFELEAIRKVDDMLTNIWLNALMCTNKYYPKFIMDMKDEADHAKWKRYANQLKEK